jgi:hypothetical protein
MRLPWLDGLTSSAHLATRYFESDLILHLHRSHKAPNPIYNAPLLHLFACGAESAKAVVTSPKSQAEVLPSLQNRVA